MKSNSKLKNAVIKTITNLIPSKSTRDSLRTAFLYLGIRETLNKISKIKKEKEPDNYKYYLSIVLKIKDEATYLKEWLEFYLIQGVDHFYIYDNESSDNIKEVLQPYIEKGLVTYETVAGRYLELQTNIYNETIEKYKNESKWIAPLDTDEFAYAPNYATLSEYLKDNEKYDQIAMKWYIYGNSGHETRPNGLVIENYNMRERKPSGPTKAFVKGTKVLYMLVHKHSVVGKTKYPDLDEIRCNHYFGKSVEEFRNKKMKRGAIDGGVLDMSMYNRLNKNEVSDLMPQEIIDKVKENLNKN